LTNKVKMEHNDTLVNKATGKEPAHFIR